MTDSVQNVLEDMRIFANEMLEIEGEDTEEAEYILDWASRIDALLAEREPVAVIRHPDLQDEAPMFSSEDMMKLRALPPNTLLYTTPQPQAPVNDRHNGLIIMDDLEDDETTHGEESYRKFKQWFAIARAPEDALRTVRKWLNEDSDAEPPRAEIAQLCAAMIAAAKEGE